GDILLADAAARLFLAGDVTATSSAAESALIKGAGQLSLDGADRTFTVNDGPLPTDLLFTAAVIDGPSSAGLIKAGAGRMEVDADFLHTGVTTITAGDVQVDGSLGAVVLAGGTLSGIGQVGTVTGTAAGGTVSPGDNGEPTP